MDDLLSKLGPSPVQRRSLECDPGINLFPYVVPRATGDMQLIDFCYWTSQIVGQAMHFVGGTYEPQGVEPRDFWAFWAPVKTPDGWYADSIFTARKVTPKMWRYALTFCATDEKLHERLAECVLHAAISEGEDYRHEAERAERTEDSGLSTTFFEVCVPTRVTHALSLLTAAQFG